MIPNWTQAQKQRAAKDINGILGKFKDGLFVRQYCMNVKFPDGDKKHCGYIEECTCS